MAEQEPFKSGTAGANAFRAAYDRLKSEADLARKNITQDFSGAYQQLRRQSYGAGLGAAAQSGLSGGQAAGMRQSVSAQQMGALGNLMQGQERAMREQKAGEASIYSNALLEGQQAQQMEQQQQQYDFQRDQQKNQILLNNEYDDNQKIQALISLGYTPEEANELVKPKTERPDYFGLGRIQEEKGFSFGLPSGGINIMGGWRNF
jgi:hypothetical protein